MKTIITLLFILCVSCMSAQTYSKAEYTDEITNRARAYLSSTLEQSTSLSFTEILMVAADTRSTNAYVIKAKAAVRYHNDVWLAVFAHIKATTYPTQLNPQDYVNAIVPPTF